MQKGDKGDVVVQVQRALNVALRKIPPIKPDGDFGQITETAIMEFQTLLRLIPDGKLSDELRDALLSHAFALGWVDKPKPADAPIWLDIAKGEAGQKEVAGISANPRILEYIATFPYLKQVASSQGMMMSETDETAWCACFVNWCLLRAGQRGGDSAMAQTWATYGQKLEAPVPGAIAVIFNAPTPGVTATGWHVSFWVGGTAQKPKLWGGNQGNTVRETDFSGWQVKAYRWPA
ncbi:MAG: uncharacterized protein JWR00_705 [Rubritepida sp.]|nr:uncharacterized protein [Rubritepida sp.]